MIMTFGKHRGKRIDRIPADYLLWVLGNCSNLPYRLRIEIEQHLDIDQPTDRTVPSIPFAELVPQWYRQLAKEFHPDKRHGSHDAMVAVNRAKELLEEMAGGV